MFNVTARTSGKSFHPLRSARCQNARIDFALLTPVSFMRQRVSVARYADRGTGCNSIIVIQPVERYADRFCSRRIFIHERLVRPRSRFADFPLDSPPVVRPESEIQISSIVDAVVSFLRSRPSRRTFEATRFSTLLSRRCDVANLANDLRASRSRIAAVPRKHTGCESLTARQLDMHDGEGNNALL